MKLHDRKPDIENLFRVLRRQAPARPTLFELFMNETLYSYLTGYDAPSRDDETAYLRYIVDAFAAGGYDYATTHACGLQFSHDEQERKGTVSMNEGFVITDEESFERYVWPDPEAFDYTKLRNIDGYLPDGMKLMVMGPGGVLENTTALVGYENMCFMLFENPQLIQAVFDKVGAVLLKYYQIAASFDSVGLLCSNDDWGFNTQTLIAPDDLRKYVFPWHRKIVQTAHAAGKPAILHSCGNLAKVIDDIVGMGFDAKHSYEDGILPVEKAYECWHDRIAILGGMDVDFMVRASNEDIYTRSAAIVQQTMVHGGYALGTGNSVPEYLPMDKYLSMTRAALEHA